MRIKLLDLCGLREGDIVHSHVATRCHGETRVSETGNGRNPMVNAAIRLFKLSLLTHVTVHRGMSPRRPVAWITEVPLSVSLYGVLKLPLTAQWLHMSSILALDFLLAGAFWLVACRAVD